MKLEHIAIWTHQLEVLRDFYIGYFGGCSNQKYTSDKGARGTFQSYFLTFDQGSRLELMELPAIPSGDNKSGFESTGLTHIAFDVETPENLDQLYERLKADGVPVAGERRITGDGYYEACVLDPDGNRVEITARPRAYTIRQATISDIDTLVTLRFHFLSAMGASIQQEEKNQLQQQLVDYFARGLEDHSFTAVLAEQNGQVLSTAYLAVSERPASPSFPTGKTGTLLNVLTYPEHQGQGIGTAVVAETVRLAKKMGLSLVELSATESGKKIYEKLGFQVPKYVSMNINI